MSRSYRGFGLEPRYLRGAPPMKVERGAPSPWPALTVLAFVFGAVGCDPKRLCEDGACESPSNLDASVTGASAVPGVGDASVTDTDPVADSTQAADAGDQMLECSEEQRCPDGSVCHPEVALCVECVANEHCSEPRPWCAESRNPLGNRCVGCRGNGDCGDALCVNDLCVACDIDSGAGCTASRPICVSRSEGAYSCVECTTNDDCGDAERPVCDVGRGACVTCLADGAGCREGTYCLAEEGEDAAVPARSRCVECTEETAQTDCRAAEPFCIDEQCVICDPESGSGCANARPYCRSREELEAEAPLGAVFPPATCSACLADEDCVQGNGRCVAGECVECRETSDCAEPNASVCNLETNTCVSCSVSADCEHIDGAHVCHRDANGEGRCVECDALDYRACDQARNVCVTAPTVEQFTCSGRKVNQVGACGECIADAECSAGQRCVYQAGEGGSSGYYCLYLEGAPDAPNSCGETSAEPFIQRVQATSVDGVSGSYCTLNTATCAVFGRFKGACMEDEDCGEPSEGAYCFPNEPDRRCSYACGGHVDCPTSNRNCINGHCSVL